MPALGVPEITHVVAAMLSPVGSAVVPDFIPQADTFAPLVTSVEGVMLMDCPV